MKILQKNLIIVLTIMVTALAVNAESLFMMGASQNNYVIEPKSLYASVRARTVGDLITVVMEESVNLTDDLTFNAERSANTTDNFSGLLNKILPGDKLINNSVNNFGGGNTVESTTKNSRAIKFQDSINAQVVQALPNGNLVIQGKKTLINTNERVDVILSGIVDPRWISDTGTVSSKNIANLQFAMSGKGSVSRSGGEGVVNRVIRYLF